VPRRAALRTIENMDVRHVAKLAHLEITDAEVELYSPQMAKIVGYVEQLNELDTGDIEPMLGGLTAEGEVTEAIRDDVTVASLGQSAAMDQAPSAVAGHFQVPKVL
jgi:aspartyl-tRNA(Asn)/glutamyl-tRNA(Gln) amidotransferase subunit C